MPVTTPLFELNLLPWRDRRRKQKIFQLLLILTVSLVSVVTATAWTGVEMWRQWSGQAAKLDDLQQRRQSMQLQLQQQADFAASADESIARFADALRSRQLSAQVSQLLDSLASFYPAVVFQTLEWQFSAFSITGRVKQSSDFSRLLNTLNDWAQGAGWQLRLETLSYRQGSGVHFELQLRALWN